MTPLAFRCVQIALPRSLPPTVTGSCSKKGKRSWRTLLTRSLPSRANCSLSKRRSKNYQVWFSISLLLILNLALTIYNCAAPPISESLRERVNKRLEDKTRPLTIRSAWDLKIRLQLLRHLETSTSEGSELMKQLKDSITSAPSFNAYYLQAMQKILNTLGCPITAALNLKVFCFSRGSWKACEACKSGFHIYESILNDHCDNLWYTRKKQMNYFLTERREEI